MLLMGKGRVARLDGKRATLCGRRKEPFHLGRQIGRCMRRVGWPVGVEG